MISAQSAQFAQFAQSVRAVRIALTSESERTEQAEQFERADRLDFPENRADEGEGAVAGGEDDGTEEDKADRTWEGSRVQRS